MLSLVLFGIAVAVHVYSQSISLPLRPSISVLAIFLPILASLNGLSYRHLRRNSLSSSSRLKQLAPFVLQILQALITTILATILFETALPSQVTECMLDSTWTRMFRTHDAEGIRRIQDALECCGLNSVKDRAYPFPGMAPSSCSQTYGRSVACREPWRGALRRASGTDLGVILAVGLLQVLSLLFVNNGPAWMTWGSGECRQTPENSESRRPLLTSGAIIEEEDEDQEEERGQLDSQLRRQDSQTQTQTQTYGAVNGDDLNVKLPPTLIAEHNAWNQE